MRTAAFIQARIGSTRLPGKVLADLAGRPVLEHVVRRVVAVPEIDQVAIVTSDLQRDDQIEALCEALDIACVRGSETDVLERFQKAAELLKPVNVVRVTGDCPLLDPSVLADLIRLFERSAADLATVAAGEPATPGLRRFPRGLDAEIFTASALRIASAEATSLFDHEHVTPFIWSRPERFKVVFLEPECDLSQYSLTLDTEADLLRIRSIYERVGTVDGCVGLSELVSMLKA